MIDCSGLRKSCATMPSTSSRPTRGTLLGFIHERAVEGRRRQARQVRGESQLGFAQPPPAPGVEEGHGADQMTPRAQWANEIVAHTEALAKRPPALVR